MQQSKEEGKRSLEEERKNKHKISVASFTEALGRSQKSGRDEREMGRNSIKHVHSLHIITLKVSF